jgi:hypothetical protein
LWATPTKSGANEKNPMPLQRIAEIARRWLIDPAHSPRWPTRSTGILSCAIASSCTPAQTPLHPERPGDAIPVTILGESYSVPPRLDVEDFRSEPGVTHLVFTDNINRCEGHILFETVGDAKIHDDYVRTSAKDRERILTEQGLNFKTTTVNYPIRAETGRLITFDISGGNAHVKQAILDVHLNARHLSIFGEIGCLDGALMDAQVAALRGFIESPETSPREENAGSPPIAGDDASKTNGSTRGRE